MSFGLASAWLEIERARADGLVDRFVRRAREVREVGQSRSQWESDAPDSGWRQVFRGGGCE